MTAQLRRRRPGDGGRARRHAAVPPGMRVHEDSRTRATPTGSRASRRSSRTTGARREARWPRRRPSAARWTRRRDSSASRSRPGRPRALRGGQLRRRAPAALAPEPVGGRQHRSARSLRLFASADVLFAGTPGEGFPAIGTSVRNAVTDEQEVIQLGLANDQLGYLIAPVHYVPIIAAEAPVNDNIIFNVSPTIGDHVMCADIAAGAVSRVRGHSPPTCAGYDAADSAGDPVARCRRRRAGPGRRVVASASVRVRRWYSACDPGQLFVTRPSAVTYQLEQPTQTLPASRSSISRTNASWTSRRTSSRSACRWRAPRRPGPRTSPAPRAARPPSRCRGSCSARRAGTCSGSRGPRCRGRPRRRAPRRPRRAGARRGPHLHRREELRRVKPVPKTIASAGWARPSAPITPSSVTSRDRAGDELDVVAAQRRIPVRGDQDALAADRVVGRGRPSCGRRAAGRSGCACESAVDGLASRAARARAA